MSQSKALLQALPNQDEQRKFWNALFSAFNASPFAEDKNTTLIFRGLGLNGKQFVSRVIEDVFAEKDLIVKTISDPVEWLTLREDPAVVIIHTTMNLDEINALRLDDDPIVLDFCGRLNVNNLSKVSSTDARQETRREFLTMLRQTRPCND